MGTRLIYGMIALTGLSFAAAFVWIVGPALRADGWNVVGGFAAGFVNPYATGYSLDAIACGVILMLWVLAERRPWGWVAIPLSFAPGVATALAYYLIVRLRKA